MNNKNNLKQIQINDQCREWKVIECIQPFRVQDNFKREWKCENIITGTIKIMQGQYLLNLRNKWVNNTQGSSLNKENDVTLIDTGENSSQDNSTILQIPKNRVLDKFGNTIGNVCRECHQLKPLDKFRDDFGTICLDCSPYAENSYGDPVNTRRAKLTEEEKRVRQQYSSIVNCDKKFGFDINKTISLQRVREITSEPCYYCGGYNYAGLTGETNIQRNYTGVDRINSTIGHEEGNCVPCCNRCNMMKGSLEVNVWLEHMQKILEFNEKMNKED